MAKMQKSKMKKIVKEKKIAKAKPKSFLELKQQQKASRIKKARAQVMKEKKLEKEQKESKKSIADVAKEQEKLVVEKQKKLGMAEELRNLYPELTDSEFNSLLKTQFGIQLPTLTALQPASMMAQAEAGKKGGRRTKDEIAKLNQKIRDASKEDLLNLLENGDFSTAEQRQIRGQLKFISLQEKRLEEEKRMKPIKEQEEAKKKEQEAKIQKRLDDERQKLDILQKREKESKDTAEKQRLQKAQADEEERIRLLEEQDKLTKKEVARLKAIQDKKQLEKDKKQLAQDYDRQEAKLQKEREALTTDFLRIQKTHKRVNARTEAEQEKQDAKYAKRQERLDRLNDKMIDLQEQQAQLELAREQGLREIDMRIEDIERGGEELELGGEGGMGDEQFQQAIEALQQEPKEVVIQEPEQAIAQAEMDAEAPEQAQADNIQVEGLGLARKYALHPSHIMEKKDKYELSKKGKKHFDNLKLFLTKPQIDYILHYSLLNKARNDKLGLSKKFSGKTVKGYRKTTRGGNIVYTKL